MGFVIHVLVLGMGCVSQNPWNLWLLTFNPCPILRIEHVEPIQLYRADRLTYFGTRKFLGKDRDRSVETQASQPTRSLLLADQKFEGSMLTCPHSKGSWWRCAARVRHIMGTPLKVICGHGHGRHLVGHLSHTLAPWQACWNIAKHAQMPCQMCLLLRLGLGPVTQHPNNQEPTIAVENFASNQQKQCSWNSTSASWAFQAAVALHTKSWYKEH